MVALFKASGALTLFHTTSVTRDVPVKHQVSRPSRVSGDGEEELRCPRVPLEVWRRGPIAISCVSVSLSSMRRCQFSSGVGGWFATRLVYSSCSLSLSLVILQLSSSSSSSSADRTKKKKPPSWFFIWRIFIFCVCFSFFLYHSVSRALSQFYSLVSLFGGGQLGEVVWEASQGGDNHAYTHKHKHATRHSPYLFLASTGWIYTIHWYALLLALHDAAARFDCVRFSLCVCLFSGWVRGERGGEWERVSLLTRFVCDSTRQLSQSLWRATDKCIESISTSRMRGRAAEADHSHEARLAECCVAGCAPTSDADDATGNAHRNTTYVTRCCAAFCGSPTRALYRSVVADVAVRNQSYRARRVT